MGGMEIETLTIEILRRLNGLGLLGTIHKPELHRQHQFQPIAARSSGRFLSVESPGVIVGQARFNCMPTGALQNFLWSVCNPHSIRNGAATRSRSKCGRVSTAGRLN